MADGGLNKWTPSRKSGGIPRVSTRFILGVENEQADAGWDGRTRLARLNYQVRTGTAKYPFFAVQLTTSRIGNITRMMYTTLAISDGYTDIHTYIL